MADAAAPSKKVFVTGGAGYIGTHTVIELLTEGYTVVVIDNMDNSSEEGLNRVRKITGCAPEALIFAKGDINDAACLEEIFKAHTFLACIHFAGKKAVGESVKMPLTYYSNNLNGTLVLLDVMGKYGCKKIIFSSSATVYGEPERLPIVESCRLSATNPYGRTKLFIEDILRDVHVADKEWDILLLRYFNPSGAHISGTIGEDPAGIPNNLMPYIAQVAVGKREMLSVFGGDWETPDGTGVRDYIHVVDLALGHVAAIKKLEKHAAVAGEVGCVPVNLGTGRGVSVLEMLAGMGKACGRELPHKICDRRPGDIASCYCDPKFAKEFLGWEATHSVEDMCADLWRWQEANPDGFKGA